MARGGPRPTPDELAWRFGTSGGPGGQHVNRTETRVECTFDIAAARSLGEDDRRRLLARFGKSITVTCDETRSQWRNRKIAYEKLCTRLAEALEVPRARVATRTTRGAKERRLAAKRRRSGTKDLRRRPDAD